MSGYGAIVLAGGAGRRLGGPEKPVLPVGGSPMLARVLSAVWDAEPRVVVGPPTLVGNLPERVILTLEQPPGSGPVAGVAAGLRLAPPGVREVALLAADLPFLTAGAVGVLRRALSTVDETVAGALFVDQDGHRQFLCGLWRAAALRAELAALGAPAGRSMRRLVAGLRVAEVRWERPGPPPWYDCDTESELRTARRWATAEPDGRPGGPNQEET